MVDATKGIGGIQNLPSSDTKKFQDDKKTEQREASGASNPVDDVSISSEASDLASADQATRAARQQLEDNQDISLSPPGSLEDILV